MKVVYKNLCPVHFNFGPIFKIPIGGSQFPKIPVKK